MASAWRVVAFFLVVFVVPVLLIALPLYARYTLYPVRSLALVASDSMDMHTMASSFWCKGQRMSSNGTFDAYLMPETPQLNKRRRKRTAVSSILRVSEVEPQVKLVHLLKGSNFAFGVCARWPGGSVIVVRGKKNFDRCYYVETEDRDDMIDRVNNVPNSVEEEFRGLRVGGRPAGRGTVKQRPKGVMPIGNIDALEEDLEDAAGEVFEESDKSAYVTEPNVETTSYLTTSDRSRRLPEYKYTIAEEISFVTSEDTTKPKKVEVSVPVASPKIDSEKVSEKPELKHSKLDIENLTNTENPENSEKGSTKGVQKLLGLPEDSNLVELERPKSVTENEVSRVVRSVRSSPRRKVPDESDEMVVENAETIRKFGLLHSINDTRDVTAGNSSVSSSEEFMAQCTDTIFYIQPDHFPDCQSRDLSEKLMYTFPVTETDDYYFIFMSDNSLEENVLHYYLTLDRVMYNISGSKEYCRNSSECAFPLRFLGSEAVVVEMRDKTGETHSEPLSALDSYEMTAVCQPRAAVYMVFILMVPFIILMFAFQ